MVEGFPKPVLIARPGTELRSRAALVPAAPMRATGAWTALLVVCLGNGMVGGPPPLVLADDATISCDPNADPGDKNLVLCERRFQQYPGCQHYEIKSWEDAHSDIYGAEGMCGSYDNTTTFWR